MNSGMVDLHCHYLPAVDDGADTLEQGLGLLRAAYAEGIDRIVLTPHINLDHYANVASTLRARFAHFQHEVERAEIPVTLILGAEVRANDDLLLLFERDEIPFYVSADGRKTLLLEFPHSHLPTGWQQLLRWLIKHDVTPLIAHPERNKEVMRHPERVGEMVAEGCLIQLTASALIGAFGANARAAAKKILTSSWATLLASDAHNLQYRPPSLRAGAETAAKLIGESRAWEMVTTIPAALAFAN